jgi:hypothetical protein
MNPAAIVAECNLRHEDLEDWGVQMQRPWVDFQREVILGPFSQLAPELSPEDASAHLPMFDKEQMSYQLAGRATGMRGAVCLTHGPNSLLCVPGRAPILQHSLLSMYAQLIIAKTVNEPDSEKPKKILEIIVRMVPQATKHEEQISYNDTANRVSQRRQQFQTALKWRDCLLRRHGLSTKSQATP